MIISYNIQTYTQSVTSSSYRFKLIRLYHFPLYGTLSDLMEHFIFKKILLLLFSMSLRGIYALNLSLFPHSVVSYLKKSILLFVNKCMIGTQHKNNCCKSYFSFLFFFGTYFKLRDQKLTKQTFSCPSHRTCISQLQATKNYYIICYGSHFFSVSYKQIGQRNFILNLFHI